MSAICGLIHRDEQPVTGQAIERVLTALEAYGPDGATLWQEDSAALGHQMLHITPESLHETLPWQDGLTGLVITADARLDNRDELISKLAIPYQVGQSLSDSQLILRAYIKWEDQCPQRLLGDFAFAIWDPHRKKLFCARDIFGVRPFFYYCSPNSFIFASDLRALLTTPEVPHRFNDALIVAYLQQQDIRFAQKSQTFFEEIHKLPPAHCLTLTPTQKKLQCYWSPDTVSNNIRLHSEADYAAMLRDLLEQAVSCRLRSAFPIGAHLSGGLDSSSIAVIAARALQTEGKPFKGFSWSPPLTTPMDSPGDERNLVEEICKLEPIECHYVSLTGQDVVKHQTQNFMTEPTTMLDFEQRVQSEISKQNIRTVLSGWGGDEAITFNGRGYFAELFLRGRWGTLYRELKLRGELHGLGLKGQLIEKVLEPLLPDALALRWRDPTGDPFLYDGQSAYIHPKLMQKVQSGRQQNIPIPYLLRERVGVRTNQRMLLDNGHLTRRIEDWAISGSQNNLVYSYPLLDRRIVEFALSIPVSLFFKHGWKRYLFRTATADLLPDAVRWNKTKLEIASFAQLKTCTAEIREDLRDRCLAQFKEYRQSSQLAEWLDMEKLERVISGDEAAEMGLGPALELVSAYADLSNTTRKSDSQPTSISS